MISKFTKAGINLLMALAIATPMLASAQVEDPIKFVELQLEGQCDPANNKLWLLNLHNSKVVHVTVRWNLAGSKRVITDKFQLAPAKRREIGCAAQADIVSAEFVLE